MASRWRTWDANFATDVLGNKFSFDVMDIMPVGTRGKYRFNIPPNLLSIPINISERSDIKVGGRGRRLRDQKEPKLNDSIKANTNKTDGYYKQLRKEFQEKEWPTLTSSTQLEANRKNKVVKPLSTNSSKILQRQFENVENDVENSVCNVNQIENTGENNDINHTQTDNIIIVEDEILRYNENQSESILSTDKTNEQTDTSYNNTVDKADVEMFCNQSFTTTTFLRNLLDPNFYILIENLSINVNEEEFKELVGSFGDIASFETERSSDGIHKNVLVRMVDNHHCPWVISCLDGDIYEDGGERISARSVDDILLEEISKVF